MFDKMKIVSPSLNGPMIRFILVLWGELSVKGWYFGFVIITKLDVLFGGFIQFTEGEF